MDELQRAFRQQYMLTWLANHHLETSETCEESLDPDSYNKELRWLAWEQCRVAWDLLVSFDQMTFSDYGEGY